MSSAAQTSSFWEHHLEREVRRYRDGRARTVSDPHKRERQLLRIAGAAHGAGRSALMVGEADHARRWLRRAVRNYRASAEFAPRMRGVASSQHSSRA